MVTKLSIFDKIYKYYSGNLSKMLIHTGAIGWILSSAAQIFAIVGNDKIPKEQKMFLIPQEAADAVVNILSFYIITQTFSSVAAKLAKTGKWIPHNVAKYLIKKGYKNKLGKLTFDISKDVKLPSKIKRSYNLFQNGLGVCGATIGSIISCNFVTPTFRNMYASNKQKAHIAKMKENEKNTNPYITKQNTQQKTIYSSNIYKNNTQLKI